jgi:predicted nucleic acid-binding protein
VQRPEWILDASTIYRALVPFHRNPKPVQLLSYAIRQEIQLAAPDFWSAEVVSSIRRAVFAGTLPATEAEMTLEEFHLFPVEVVPIDFKISRAALVWAERLQQAKAYDALYLSLAEARKAIFWTADERLIRRCRQLRVPWVHDVQDFEPPAAE